MRIKTIHIIKTWLTFVLLLLASKTLAAEVSLPTIPGAPKITENTLLPEFIVYIYYFAVVVSGFVAFAILLYGGIKYLTSGDSPAKKAEARGLLGGGLIGLLILLLAYIILNTINPQLTIFQTNIATPDLTIPAANYYGTIDLTKSTYQEVPLGTLIENVLDQNKIEDFKNFLKEVEEKSEKVLQKADDLKKETEKCSCTASTMTGASCTLQVDTCYLNAGSCTGEPCDRMALEQKKQDLNDAFTELKNFVEPKTDFLQNYLDDMAALYYASLLMKEGLFPTPYEQAIELEQLSLNYTGATIDFIPFRFGGKEIRATGYDPMNFYFDYIANKEIFEDIGFNDFGLYVTVPPSVTNPNIPNNPPVSNPGGLINPLPGSCTTGGWESYEGHKGIDLADGCPTNSPVVAAADGEIIEIHTGCPENPTDPAGMDCGWGWGNYIEIWHPQLNIITRYAHLKSPSPGLKVGDRVNQGEQIGIEDTTGTTYGYCPGPGGEHLHFEVLDVNGNRMPPEPWLPPIPDC